MIEWSIYPQNYELSSSLAKELNVSPYLAQILQNRGFLTFDSAYKFLYPKLMHLKDPFDIPHIKKAADRVLLAKERGEKILVYGDYDVDGVTGTGIVIEALRKIGIEARSYIPYRYGEGYSLNVSAIRKIKEEKISLIITVDCGISNFLEIEEATALNIDVIITDHHNLPNKLPNAYAIVNPKLIKEDHPSKDLSGAGVAFKFAWALFRCANISENSFLTNLLDLAALGTIADIVALTNENRIITKQGLVMINKQEKRIGLEALITILGLKGPISTRDVNFGIAPRINAAGRLEHASLSLNLLISKDPIEAKKFAKELNKLNSKRQEIGDVINNQVFSQITDQNLSSNKIIIAVGKNWHPGVIGIIASRVVEKFYKPAVLISINEDIGRGSARSIDNLNIFKILASCQDLYTDFGGHEGAAGFEIEKQNIEELKTRLLKATEGLDFDFNPKLHVDLELKPEQATLAFAEELKLLEPHGEKNPSPIFLSKRLKLLDVWTVGNNNSHLKIKFASGSYTFDVIGFGFGEHKNQISPNSYYDIAYSISSNQWNGFDNVQFNLVDLKPSEKL